MKTVKLNAIIDIASLIMLVPVMISGAVTLWILPSGGSGFQGGSGDISSMIFLGMTRQEWRDIHDITGMLFFILVAIHLFLHFRYFRNIGRCFETKGQDGCDTRK
jgi:hypothetical protein